VFPCIALHFSSLKTDGTPLQLLRGCPLCHLNSALPLCLVSIFQHVHLSIFVWWHLLCGFHSSDCWLTPSILLAQPCEMLIVWYNGMQDSESKSQQWVCCLLVLIAISAFFSPGRGPHSQNTHGKDKQLFCFDNQCQWDLRLTVSVCCVCVHAFVWVYECLSRATSRVEWPNTMYTLLSRPGQGKTC